MKFEVRIENQSYVVCMLYISMTFILRLLKKSLPQNMILLISQRRKEGGRGGGRETGREGERDGGKQRETQTDRHIKLVATSMCEHIPSWGFEPWYVRAQIRN